MICLKKCRAEELEVQLIDSIQTTINVRDDLIKSIETHIDTINRNYEEKQQLIDEISNCRYQKEVLKSVLYLIAEGKSINSLEAARKIASIAVNNADKPLPSSK